MKTSAATSIALTLTLLGSTLCSAGSITYGTDIEVSGNLKLTAPATGYCFYDGTCMQSAINPNSVQWGDITGIIQNQTDLQEQMATKQDVAQKGVANGYAPLNAAGKIQPTYLYKSSPVTHTTNVLGSTPEWQNQGLTWTPLLYGANPVSVAFLPSSDHPYIRLQYQDNVGISGSVWCNLGIFRNAETTPICFGSWSGSYTNATFQQVSLDCVVQSLLPACTLEAQFCPAETYTVKHRSQMCVYGNYWSDEFSTMRKFTIQDL